MSSEFTGSDLAGSGREQRRLRAISVETVETVGCCGADGVVARDSFTENWGGWGLEDAHSEKYDE